MASLLHVDPATRFASAFRGTAYQASEYSFDARPECHGIMVAGGPGFYPTIGAFAETLPYAAEWAWRLRRFVAAVQPDSYLFRVDWSGAAAIKITAYCRFPQEPDDEAFQRATDQLGSTRWTGPSPGRIAAAIDVAGPRGIGFEVSTDGNPDLSVYFRVPAVVSALSAGATERLIAAAGLPAELAESIDADVRDLYRSVSVGVIGIDNGPDGTSGALKFNPPNVSLEAAMEFLDSKGADPGRLDQITDVARSLRARWISYLGVRYQSTGFAGWRVYLSVAPQRFAGVLRPHLAVEPEAIPTLMLPHF
jgi:hypothetical protein